MPDLIFISSKIIRSQEWIPKCYQEAKHICYDMECIAHCEHIWTLKNDIQNLLQRPMRPVCSKLEHSWRV